jgi:hypothetical protein
MAASLSKEAKELRAQKPGGGGGGSVRQKRALRSVQNAEATQRKQTAVRLEVTARIDALKAGL